MPILFDRMVAGQKRKLISIANRNAFYYVLDRTNGEFIFGRRYAKQTWAQGLEAKGRPIMALNAQPTEEGALIYPNANGATVWLSPSYSPQTGLVYVPVREIGASYFKRNTPYRAGTMFAGGGENELPPDDSWGAIRALQAETGEMRSEFKLLSPLWAGVLSTAGGLVFSGSDEGNFYALDAENGSCCGTFRLVERSLPIRSRSPSMDSSASRLRRIGCCLSSACSYFVSDAPGQSQAVQPRVETF